MAGVSYRPEEFLSRLLPRDRFPECRCGSHAVPDRAYLGRLVCRRCGWLIPGSKARSAGPVQAQARKTA